jgi:hypothetical protein
MALRWRNAPPGAKMMTILVIMIPAISLCVMIYFILKQFVLSKDECKKHSDCHHSEYCAYLPPVKHNVCTGCCEGLSKGTNCGACIKDPHRIGDKSLCPDFTCDTSQ